MKFLFLPITSASVKTPGSRVFQLALITLMITACDASFLASAEKLKAQVKQAIEAKDFSQAASAAQKLIEKSPEDYEGYFVLAQAKAQTGDKNAAIGALEQAMKKGLKDDQQIEANKNLEPIRDMSAYSDLMKAAFPSRAALATVPGISVHGQAGAAVSITEADGRQTIRAGDIVIQTSTDK
jgi:DNA-binding SARP family transcriptional activator